MCKKI